MARRAKFDLLVIALPPIVAALLTAAIMAQLGTGIHGTREALRATARVAFLIWLAVFAASPLNTLIGAGWTAGLVQARRRIGMSFATFHLVHVVLIVYLFKISPTPPVPDFVILLGGIGLLLVYAMFFTSFDVFKSLIPVKSWKLLHSIALYYLSGVFTFDLIHNPFTKSPLIYYLPFTILLSLGFALRLLAWAKKRADREREFTARVSAQTA